MGFQNNDTQSLLELTKELGRKFRTSSHEIDQKALWPEKNIRDLQDAGLGGLMVSKKLGGRGEGYLAMVMSCEILGEYCASTSMCYGMHLVASKVISAKATSYHEEHFLRPIAEGKHWTTLSLSEPGTGSHFYIPQTQMQLTSDNLIINGQKSFVTNGGHADSYVMSVVSQTAEESIGEFSCVVIPKESQGLNWNQPWNGFGMRGNASRSVTLKNVTVPANHILGNTGEQLWYVFEVVAPNFLLAMSGTYLGIANAALNEATEHLQKRKHSHSGSTLAASQVLQHRLGTLWGRVESTKQLIYSAASRLDNGDTTAMLAILSAKAEVADTTVDVVNEALTLIGGEGYGSTGSMGRHLRDARAAHVMSPTTDLLRTWVGRALLKLPLLGE